jgi:hypothetical protein
VPLPHLDLRSENQMFDAAFVKKPKAWARRLERLFTVSFENQALAA